MCYVYREQYITYDKYGQETIQYYYSISSVYDPYVECIGTFDSYEEAFDYVKHLK